MMVKKLEPAAVNEDLTPSRERWLSEIKGIFTKPKAYAKAPWWLVSLATGANSFVDNPILGNPFFNALGLHAKRVVLAAQLTAQRRQQLEHLVSAEDKAFFDEHGFVIKENFMAEQDFLGLQQELLGTEFEARETLQGDTVTRRIALDGLTLENLPFTRQLLNDPVWQGLLSYIGSFRAQPLIYLQSILTNVRVFRADPQTNLHADTFHSSVKAWLFLHDVAEDEGPFVYVPGSHRLTPERLAWEKQRSLTVTSSDRMSSRGSLRIKSKELAALGLPPPKAFAVKKNTLVVADTFGFHARGQTSKPAVRVEVWAFSRRNPFLPVTGFDPLKLPVIQDRLVPLYWWGLDQLEAHGWRKNPWRAVGRLRAQDPARLTKK